MSRPPVYADFPSDGFLPLHRELCPSCERLVPTEWPWSVHTCYDAAELRRREKERDP